MTTAPAIRQMASGNLSLLITENISWESFPEQAQEFVDRFEGKVIYKIDTPVERMWLILIKWRPFCLTFDDLPLGLTLESMIRSCNPIVHQIHKELTANAA
jgi:hypothetical protein